MNRGEPIDRVSNKGELIKRDAQSILSTAFKPTMPNQTAFMVQGARGTKFAFIGPDGGVSVKNALKLGAFITERG